jgi:hypothetical protein
MAAFSRVDGKTEATVARSRTPDNPADFQQSLAKRSSQQGSAALRGITHGVR